MDTTSRIALDPVISVCIPTYNRPHFFKEALESCLAQGYRPLQILVGDDSSNDETHQILEGLRLPAGITVCYQHNIPSLGQAGNVNDLFDRASGQRLTLLHDDDMFCEGAIELLHRNWTELSGIRCIYGQQIIVSAEGVPSWESTEALNKETRRGGIHLGRQTSGLSAGFWQQIPNDCFLIETQLARAVRYRREIDVGHSVDADFGIRLGLATKPGELACLDSFISKYRLSTESILRSGGGNYGHHLFFKSVEDVQTNADEQGAKDVLLCRIALGASLDAAMAGDRALAFRIMQSKYYTKAFFSRWTLLRLLCIASPRHGGALRDRLRTKLK